jgi:hypothetical protein
MRSSALKSAIAIVEVCLGGLAACAASHSKKDADCIREISYVKLPAALAAELDLSRVASHP